jgi:hypothetical protein
MTRGTSRDPTPVSAFPGGFLIGLLIETAIFRAIEARTVTLWRM